MIGLPCQFRRCYMAQKSAWQISARKKANERGFKNFRYDDDMCDVTLSNESFISDLFHWCG